MCGVILKKLAIVGVGLIGGSLALALKKAGVVRTVSGWDADGENLKLAGQLGVVDVVADCVAEAVKDADLVVLAVPVGSMLLAAQAVLPHMQAGAVLSDTGSVKQSVVEEVESLAQQAGVYFVGGHPISGTERSGAGAAFAQLYRGKRCILTPTSVTDARALALVEQVWQAAGSVVVMMDVVKHDRILAAISHLPHMIAYSLVNSVSSYDRYSENILDFSAGGFRDFTRIASSDPVMWRDIALSNRESLLEMITQFEQFLAELKQDIASCDEARLFEFFHRSKISRDAILPPPQKDH
ncbi:MAG: prephenate dehydrogenase/arogenate dehydrogenase family protein [Thermodesulfobacteriota bacterium]|nr:prephenate dehydrogenase/arogenate dehydrogenase family protein [Thermodesulfobacteriota bacterium]